jgi:hypothetical protein
MPAGDGVSSTPHRSDLIVSSRKNRSSEPESCYLLILKLGFYINLPMGAVTVLALVVIRVPDARIDAQFKLPFKKKLERLDLLGSVLFASVIVMLLMALNWGGVKYTWGSPVIIGLLCGSTVTFSVFILWERWQGEAAMLPLKFFRDIKISCSAASGMMSYGGLYVTIVYLPLWFQAVKGVSALRSGVYYLPSVLTTITFTVLSGFLGELSKSATRLDEADDNFQSPLLVFTLRSWSLAEPLQPSLEV